jgi:hypothetical protein
MPPRYRSMASICPGDGSKCGSMGGADLLGRVGPRAAPTRCLIARTGLSGCSAIHASIARKNSCENAALICAASDFSSGRFGGRPRPRFADLFLEGDFLDWEKRASSERTVANRCCLALEHGVRIQVLGIFQVAISWTANFTRSVPESAMRRWS